MADVQVKNIDIRTVYMCEHLSSFEMYLRMCSMKVFKNIQRINDVCCHVMIYQ